MTTHVASLESHQTPNKNGFSTRTTYRASCSCGWHALNGALTKAGGRSEIASHVATYLLPEVS